MSFQKDCSDHQFHSKKNLSLHETSNVEDNDIPLLKIKRSRSHENLTTISSKPIKDSKKKVSNISAQNQDGKLLKENKCKSNTNSKVCYCAPTTHEGSFKCRLHRVSATKKSAYVDSIESYYMRCSKFEDKYKKLQLSRFGRVASAEYLNLEIVNSNISAQNQDGKVLKENKCKSNTNTNVCYCAPTTHEESYYVRCHKFEHKYKKLQLPKFGRVASAESLIQLSKLESS